MVFDGRNRPRNRSAQRPEGARGRLKVVASGRFPGSKSGPKSGPKSGQKPGPRLGAKPSPGRRPSESSRTPIASGDRPSRRLLLDPRRGDRSLESRSSRRGRRGVGPEPQLPEPTGLRGDRRRRRRALRSQHQQAANDIRPSRPTRSRPLAAPSRPSRRRGSRRRNQPVGSLAALWKQRSQQRQRRPAAPPVSPLVYVLRLLIVGIGLGVIAGTVLASLDPSLRYSGASAESAAVAQPPKPQGLQLSREMPALAAKLQALISANEGLTAGLMVVDLERESYVAINASQRFAAASTIKLPLLVALLEQVDGGKVNLDESLSLTAADLADEAGEMQFQPLGTQFSVLKTATEMIRISDNTATNLVIRRLGGTELLNDRFRSWGLKQTQLNNLLPDLPGTNGTSPQDLVTLLGRVHRGEILSARSRELLFRILTMTETNELLPEGLGEGAAIAHKTGNIGTSVGDVGRITLPSGKQYLMMVMVQRPPGDERAEALIRSLSSETYQFLESTEQKSEQLPPPHGPRSNIAGGELELDPSVMTTEP